MTWLLIQNRRGIGFGNEIMRRRKGPGDNCRCYQQRQLPMPAFASGPGHQVRPPRRYKERHACSYRRVCDTEKATEARHRLERQCMRQPQEAVPTQRNQTILQRDTHAQKTKQSYRWPHPKPYQVNANTSHVYRDASARTRSPGG